MEATRPTNTPNQPSKRSYRNNKGLMQAYILRDLAANQAVVLESVVANDVKEQAAKAGAIRDMCAVWSQASERIRLLRGRPLPGSLRPTSSKKRRKAPQGPLFTELPADSSSTADPADPTEPQS